MPHLSLRRRVCGQDGAAAVIVGLSLLLLFGAAAIAIDLGSGWETKRDLVADTDAAALAAAADVLGTCTPAAATAARDTATRMLTANLGAAPDATDLDVRLDCNTGAVTVEYVEEAQTTLSPAIGHDELPVLSSSTAAADYEGGGLRPFSVCMHDARIVDWLAGDGDQDGDTAERNILRLDHTKSWDGAPDTEPSPCGGAPGNWGFVCFDQDYGKAGGSSVAVDNPCGNDGVQHMIRSGYQGSVDLGDGTPSDPPDCAPDTAADDACDVKTGGLGGSINDDLAAIRCPDSTDGPDCPVQFPILGVSAYTPAAGPGGTATLDPTHFIGVVLRDYRTNPTHLAYIDFELVAIFAGGSSATASQDTLTPLPPVVCGVDPSANYC